MTLIGVAIGISAFVSLTSVSNGFKAQLQDLIKSNNIDITVTSKGSATPSGSSISLSDYHKLQGIKGVKDTTSLIVGPTRSQLNPYFLLFGVSSVETFLNKLGIVEGRLFIPGKKEMLLGERTAKRFNVKVNDKILLADQEVFIVTGIYTSGSRIVDGAAVLDLNDARRILKRDGSINMAFIQVAIGSNSQEVINEINKHFQNLSAVRSGEFIGQIRLLKTVDVFAWTVSIISFFTCCIIVMNTFVMVVSERTKEIGILMAVGWTRLMIMNTIICEAIMVCFFGGLLGNLIGMFQLWVFYTINPEGLGWLVPMTSSINIFLESIGLSLLLGIVGSLYPAFRASKLLPAEALRYE